MTLETLFARASISRYYQALWFKRVRLVQCTLLVADVDDFNYISHCYAPRMQAVWPELVVTFSPASEKKPEAKPKSSCFKKVYTGKIDVKADQGDLY